MLMLHGARRMGLSQKFPGSRWCRMKVSIPGGEPLVLGETSNPSSAVILSHGLGDTAYGWVDGAQILAAALPGTRFILPTAPVQPVTLNGGMACNSWYDIKGLSDRADESCDGIEESRAYIEQLIDGVLETGLPLEKIIVAGFSQGGALSLYTGLLRRKKLAGIVCMSGYLPFTQKFTPAEEVITTPVLHCHGSADQVVRLPWAEAGCRRLQETGVSVQW
eukprot:CAMPEP_0178372640 /NCGR_PEP_ID=MMETSP0689_2-20121128/1457_1 /TAXON_ID=160604 /ORGANISM="Amphidinium massartii, Strain CS-259" /LENGTH=219 /DNA_ID=CAMNT_0019992569 /DNA_START=101 /DNA_END=757 /DNA_ORIENTATION=+